MSTPAPPVRPERVARRRAPARPHVPRPRALFYSHDARGLGQLRRVTALASALLERQPETLCLVVTGSLESHAFPSLRNIDFVKLPAMTRAPLYAGLPGDPTRSGVGELAGLREALLHQAIEAFAPQLLYVDNAPAGWHGELRRALARLHTAPSRPRIVLGLTDAIDSNAWLHDDSVELLEQIYDEILVFGEHDPLAEFQRSPAVQDKTHVCGYLGAAAPLTPADEIRAQLGVQPAQPLVVVTAGGGEDGGSLMRAWLAAARLPELVGVASCVVTGPLLDASARTELAALADPLPNLALLPFVSDLPSYLNAADLVVTLGGYSTLVESLSLGKRTLVVPGADSREQQVHARAHAQHGRLTLLPANMLTPARLAYAAQRALETPPRAALRATGIERAVERLVLAWVEGVEGTGNRGGKAFLPSSPLPCSLSSVPSTPSAPPPSHRIVLYSHDGYGLGHTRINMTVATELARRLPEAAFLLLSSAMTAHAHELPANFDYVRLPSVGKEDLYVDLPQTGSTPALLKGYYRLREALVLEAINAFAPDLFWVDDNPGGIGGDLARALACLHAADPPISLVFGVKDINDHAHVVQRNWSRDGSYYLLDEVYDRILIYGDPRFYDSSAGLAFGPAALAKTHYCGFLVRGDPCESAEALRAQLGVGPDQPLLVVTTGGGADGGDLVRATLQALHEPALAGAAAFIVTGPWLPPDEQAQLVELTATLPDVTIVPFTTALHSYLNAADLVITMGGLTVFEIARLGKRMLIVPRVKWWAEQRLRAERLVELGLASMLLPNELSGAALAHLASSALAEPPPQAAFDLDFDGVRHVGDELVALLEQKSVRRRS